MAIRSDLGTDPEKPWFVGEDKLIDFEIVADDGKLPDDPTKGVEDVTSWEMVFTLAKTDKAPALVMKRTAGGGISVVGIYNSDRLVNTQRVRVTILDDDTDGLTEWTYRYSLKRLMDNGDAVLSYGDAVIHKSTAPAA